MQEDARRLKRERLETCGVWGWRRLAGLGCSAPQCQTVNGSENGKQAEEEARWLLLTSKLAGGGGMGVGGRLWGREAARFLV